MTTTNRELADQAQAIMQASGGLRKDAARCVSVALAYSPSVRMAREALEALERPDVRQAALHLLDELTAAERAV